ncbi:hypothetical protein [Hafnia sp. HMSC23F03]|uniref:hypothetical protein n=1 Tax=Hafnia sp. HMSC23F03 TaxID=1581059 RepID=UPI0008A1F89A|nr:hypothetical protein [Hafnia sp. HMSC23F03]OFS10503.1 hypothetical protein HMPREF3091_09870 [Hafnia sp. HMSC23F03]
MDKSVLAKNSKNYAAEKLWLILYSTIFVIGFLCYVFGGSVLPGIFMVAMLLSSVLVLVDGIKKNELLTAVFFLFLFLFGALITSKESERLAIIVNSFIFFASFLLSCHLMKKRVAINFSIFSFLFSHLYFLGFVFYCLYKFGTVNENLYNSIFEGNSRNIVSAVLLMTSVFLFFSSYLFKEKVYFSALVLDLICSVLLFGRSGIFLSFAVLLLGIYVKFFKGSFLKGVVLCTMIVLFFSISFAFLGLDEFTSLLDKTNISSGFDTPRFEMWSQYIENMDIRRFFLGGDFFYSPAIMAFNGNPHNSFIMLQSRFGICAIVLFSIMIYRLFFLIRTDVVLFFLIMTLFIRMFFDVFALFGFFDYIWICMLFGLRKNNEAVFYER